MRMHMRKHEGVAAVVDAPFKCTECARGFTSKAALQSHERQHTTLLILKCKRCPKEFATRYELKEHADTHATGFADDAIDEDVEAEADEPAQLAPLFECPECDSVFGLETHLNAHMVMQHNERAKKFHCTKCTKSYAIE